MQSEQTKSPIAAIFICLASWLVAIAVGISVGQLLGLLCGLSVLIGVPAIWMAREYLSAMNDAQKPS